MSDFVVVGQHSEALRDRDVITGMARFPLDLSFPEMLTGKLLYADRPCTRNTHLDVSQTRRLPGVAVILTHLDLPGENSFNYHGLTDQPVQVVDYAHFQGNAIAAVAAEDETAAQAALNPIKVRYRDFPGVFDVEEAMRPGERQVWEQQPNNYNRTVIQTGNIALGINENEADVIGERTDATQ